MIETLKLKLVVQASENCSVSTVIPIFGKLMNMQILCLVYRPILCIYSVAHVQVLPNTGFAYLSKMEQDNQVFKIRPHQGNCKHVGLLKTKVLDTWETDVPDSDQPPEIDFFLGKTQFGLVHLKQRWDKKVKCHLLNKWWAWEISVWGMEIFNLVFCGNMTSSKGTEF